MLQRKFLPEIIIRRGIRDVPRILGRVGSTCQTVFLDCSDFYRRYRTYILYRLYPPAQCRDTSRQNVVTFHHTRVRFPFAPFSEFCGRSILRSLGFLRAARSTFILTS